AMETSGVGMDWCLRSHISFRSLNTSRQERSNPTDARIRIRLSNSFYSLRGLSGLSDICPFSTCLAANAAAIESDRQRAALSTAGLRFHSSPLYACSKPDSLPAGEAMFSMSAIE